MGRGPLPELVRRASMCRTSAGWTTTRHPPLELPATLSPLAASVQTGDRRSVQSVAHLGWACIAAGLELLLRLMARGPLSDAVPFDRDGPRRAEEVPDTEAVTS